MKRNRLLLGMAASLVLGLAPADAAVLCSTPRGTVRVREACRVGDTQVDPAALGLTARSEVFAYAHYQRAALRAAPGVTVATLSLPEGTYAIHARLRVRNTGAADAVAFCSLAGDGVPGLDATGRVWLAPPSEPGSEQGVAVLDLAFKAAGSDPEVRLECIGDPGVVALNPQLVATSATVHLQ